MHQQYKLQIFQDSSLSAAATAVPCNSSNHQDEKSRLPRDFKKDKKIAKQHIILTLRKLHIWPHTPRDGSPTSPKGYQHMLGLVSIPSVMPNPGFRFWIDEALWSHGRTAVHMIESALLQAGGIRTGGPPRCLTRGQGGNHLGNHHLDKWELLWSKSTYALGAARGLRPGQAISAVVGLNCLTMKKRMQQTLKGMYGYGAFECLMPLSFALPEELSEWECWVKANPSLDPGLWILKTGQDAGKGLKLLTTKNAIKLASKEAAALMKHKVSSTQKGGTTIGLEDMDVPLKHSHQLKVAQVYMVRPMLLDGRKWHIRLWLVLTSHNPLRAYLHNRGLVLFSSQDYCQSEPLNSDGSIAHGHITNLARNSSGRVWSLEQLKMHIDHNSPGAFGQLWTKLLLSCGKCLSAAHQVLLDGHHWLMPGIECYGFQLLGVDFIIDEDLKPWLLEFNSSPSIMVEHDDPTTQQLIHNEKEAMLRDMVAMLLPRLHRPRALNQESNTEETALGGFVPLMQFC